MLLSSALRISRPIFRYSEKKLILSRRSICSSFSLLSDNKNNKDAVFDVNSAILNEPHKNVIEHTQQEQPSSFHVDEMIMNSARSTESFNVTGNSFSDGNDGEEYMGDDDDIASQILNIALEHVPTYGWSQRAIDAAVESLELSPSSSGMFKRGAADLVIHFVEKCNNELSDILAAESKRFSSGKTLSDEDVSKFIEKAIQTRLQMITPYINSWPQAMAILASPSVASDCFENGAHMVDEIWYHAGDMATDMSWYAKRGAVAAIYLATEVFMLQDKSLNFQDTWEFLKRRMQDAGSAEAMKNSLSHAVNDIANLANAGVTTAQNILGFNNRNR